ncbi:MAG: D-alanyl-D-alanine carboxypeptidase [Thermoleophilia bacterium]|nr:D-alanyl-D-alanine carboxypeptidase [Thermoleophilia bacterium]
MLGGIRRPVLLATAALVIAAPVASAAAPAPVARAWILVNPATDEVLASRNPDMRLPMASTTKMMTALVAVERSRPEQRVRVTAAAAAVGESSAELVAGERLRMRDLLTGVLVASGNDAATAVADAVGGSDAGFVRLMNARATALGLRNTHFANPHGLDAPGHHSSARDLAAIGEALMDVPELRAMVAHRTAVIPGPNGRGRRLLESHNLLLDIDPDADGIKTGQTEGAGYALVAHATRTRLGVDLYAVLLGSTGEVQRARDAKRLLDWGFRQYARPVLVNRGRAMVQVAVRDRPGVRLVLRSGGTPLRATIRLGRPVRQAIEAPGEVVAPVARGQVVGRLVIRQDGRVLGTRPLVADADVEGPGIMERLRSGISALLP